MFLGRRQYERTPGSRLCRASVRRTTTSRITTTAKRGEYPITPCRPRAFVKRAPPRKAISGESEKLDDRTRVLNTYAHAWDGPPPRGGQELSESARARPTSPPIRGRRQLVTSLYLRARTHTHTYVRTVYVIVIITCVQILNVVTRAPDNWVGVWGYTLGRLHRSPRTPPLGSVKISVVRVAVARK